MGVIGRTLLATSLVATVSSQGVSYGACLPLDTQLPAGFSCSGTSIVNTSGQFFSIVGNTLVAIAAPTNVGCPPASQLPTGYQCAFNAQGYVVEINTGFLLRQVGQNLEYIRVLANGVLPSGFSIKNDGTGQLSGPAGETWAADLSSDFRVYPVTATGISETYECPLSQLPQDYTCDSAAPDYIIGPNDGYFVRTSATGITPLTVSGTVAPTGFTWSVAFTRLLGPRGFSWDVNSVGGMTKNTIAGVAVAGQCNSGQPLPTGYRCAGFGFGYILDIGNEYYFINANLQIERLTIGANNVAPNGFTVLEGATTLADPGNNVYSINAQRQLVRQSAADIQITTCPANRLPFGFLCAAADPRFLGDGNGLFGYVINFDINGLWNYYVVTRDATGAEKLTPLASVNGAVPRGFTVLPTTIAQGTRLRGPDNQDNIGGGNVPNDNVFMILSNGVLAATTDAVQAPNQANEVACDLLDDLLPQGYSCASNGGGLNDDPPFNYVMGPGFNYFVITSATQIDRLRVQNNVAPPGFTPISTINGVTTLDGPEENGFVYRVLADGRLQAENPNAAREVLQSGGCPASQLPAAFQCPITGTQWGYVMGTTVEFCLPADNGCFWEYFIVDRTQTPARLVRLRITGNTYPEGFSLLSDDNSKLRGPVTNGRVYSVNPATGVLESEDAPTDGPTVAYYCNDAWLPSPPFRCVNTEMTNPASCGLPTPNSCAFGNRFPFNSLSATDQNECFRQCERRRRGIEGSFAAGGDTITFAGGNQEVIVVQNAYGYMVDTLAYNYYVLEGRSIVRLAVENGEIPDGFTRTNDQQRLRGPDADVDALGWEYDILADGTLVATGGSIPQATITTTLCPAERLNADFSCVEVANNEVGYLFYIRDDRLSPATPTLPVRRSNNLYVVNADGRTMSQLSVAGTLDIAPAGFSFNTETELIGPLGYRYLLLSNRRIAFDWLSPSQPLIPQDCAALAGTECDAKPVDNGFTGVLACKEYNRWFENDVVPGDATTATTVAHTFLMIVNTGGTVVSTTTNPNPNRLITGGTNTRMPVATLGTYRVPITPRCWPTATNNQGFYLDPNGNQYRFVYAEINGFTAHIVYNP